VHPLLERLGAVPATALAVLASPALRAAVAADEEGSLASAVLELVAATDDSTGLPDWLGGLPLRDDAGELTPARELYVPGTPVTAWLEDLPLPAEPLPPGLLRRLGANDTFRVVIAADVALDDDCWHGLPDEDAWRDDVLSGLPGQPVPPVLGELAAVADLDLVREDAWPAVLAALAADPRSRAALVEPAWVTLADGSRRRVEPYQVWWLRWHARLGGWPLADCCAPDAEPVVHRLAAPLPDAADLDAAVLAALGLPRTLGDLAARTDRLLSRLADPSLDLPATDLGRCYAAMVAAVADGGARPPGPVPRLRVPAAGGTRVVPRGDVHVVPEPALLPWAGATALPGGPALATLLRVRLVGRPADPAGGEAQPVPDGVRRLLAGAPASYVLHDDLVVGGRSVEWWVSQDGAVHAATVRGLARGLAWTAGAWWARGLVAEVLSDPAAVDDLAAELAFG
jgi:hypothetical protein